MTDEQLKQIVPNSFSNDRYNFLTQFNELDSKYGIEGQIAAAFIAQTAHESGYFRYLQECGTGKEYEFRKDLGNTKSGDGIKYKGRGYIQITGKYNYKKFQDWLGGAPDIMDNPSLVSQPHLAMLATIWFWDTRGCNDLAAKGLFESLTKRINGGLNGYADRFAMYERAKKILG